MLSMDVAVVAGDSNAKLDDLQETEQYIHGPFGVPIDHTDNDDCLTQVSCDYRLLRANLNLTSAHLAPTSAFTVLDSD